MDENNKEKIILELSLVLIYLNGWEEDKRTAPGEKVFRTWKGYKFEILDKLQGQGLSGRRCQANDFTFLPPAARGRFLKKPPPGP